MSRGKRCIETSHDMKHPRVCRASAWGSEQMLGRIVEPRDCLCHSIQARLTLLATTNNTGQTQTTANPDAARLAVVVDQWIVEYILIRPMRNLAFRQA